MIEKKRMWAVTRDFEITERVAIVDEGKVLLSKKPGTSDSCYTDGWNIIRFFNTEESAKEWIENEENDIRAMVPKVKKFIDKMDSLYFYVSEKLHIKKTDYLGRYGRDSEEGYRQMFIDESSYAKKLETFAKCRMLDIDGHMIPIDRVREVKWYGCNSADEDSPNEWRAVLTTPNGDEYVTNSEEDVRLVWATIGKCSENWSIDDDIDYSKSEENEE